jgi:hypothetical protein
MSGQDNDFGTAVDVDGTTLVVGAPWGSDHPTVIPHQAVYVYEVGAAGEWWLAQTLLPPVDQDVYPAFGHSVAIDGDVFVVGAPLANSGAGLAFVYERDASGPAAWKLVATFSGEIDGYLGYSVAVEQGLVVVGAPFEGGTSDEGRVHVYERDERGWQEVGLLAGGESTWSLGWSVATNGAVVLAGTPIGNALEQCGTARFFERDASGQWIEQKVFLEPPFGGCWGSKFGEFVSLSGESAAISSGWGSSVSLFERDPADGLWKHGAFITVPSGINSGLVLDGDRFFVSTSNRVHVYRHVGTDWTFEETLIGKSTSTGFGASVAARGQEIFVGDPSFKNKALDAFGAVHVFQSPGALPSGTATSSAPPSSGHPVISARGVTTATATAGLQVAASPL